jgi:hypothetical protein
VKPAILKLLSALHGRAENARGTSDVVVQRLRQVSQFRSNVSRQPVESGKIGDGRGSFWSWQLQAVGRSHSDRLTSDSPVNRNRLSIHRALSIAIYFFSDLEACRDLPASIEGLVVPLSEE